ncbi:hypothetical protein HMPREF9436_01376 [Faecalibacterium cf. prausnitzii KLE1255]|uniref:Uncharacterized protein n=1 Tax=Faecalibacterium cf. prausnitzii KLE1255 TaxID=748224 RepID=E2ZI85_9FIRM|nr:hypothetical protein HMPREF9436_01376 [Faecalibacterium cf. prausnitzii KLE1255]
MQKDHIGFTIEKRRRDGICKAFHDRNSYFSFGQTAEQRTPWLETAEGFFAFVKKERRAGAQKSMDG